MQFEFFRNLTRRSDAAAPLVVGGRPVALVMIRNPRARRYVLRLRPDGTARVTIPRGGLAKAARQFAERNTTWLAQALQRQAARPIQSQEWAIGSAIWFRGERLVLERVLGTEENAVQFGSEVVRVPDLATDLRPAIEHHLRQVATRELPARTRAFAARHQVPISRITIRNQRSRWGSCSRRGTISLNWRLIQTPSPVQDYIILHELMHRRQMNHSARFWREVASVCPDYKVAEHWLKQNAALLR